jgi:hypothetical protein
VAKGLAPGWSNSLGGISPTYGAEKVAELFTDPWRFGRRSPDQPIDPDHTGLCKVLEPVERIRLRHLDQSIPIPEDFEDCNFGWSESLVATPRARRTTHQMN